MKALRDPFFISVAGMAIILAMAWGQLLPIHEAPDEQNHYRYMQFLRHEARMPVQLPLPSDVLGEGHQPPLYYAWGALMLRLFQPEAQYAELPQNPSPAAAYFIHAKDDWAPHLLRMLQLFMLALTLCALWLFLDFSGAPAARLAFALLALNPAFLFLNGALNNDHIGILSCAWATYWLAKIEDWERRDSIVLGLIFGLGALGKLSILPLLPLAFWIGRRKPLELAIMTAIFLILAGPYFVFNVRHYGDPFAWNVIAATCPQCVHPKNILDLRWWWFFASRSFDSFWGVFGWFTWRAPMAFTWALFALALAALRKPSSRLGLLMSFAFLLQFIGILKHQLAFDPPEGRYFYPAMLPIAFFFATGLGPVKWTAPLLALGLGLFNAWLLIYRLIPLYYHVVS